VRGASQKNRAFRIDCGYSDCTELNLTSSIGNCNSILES
jgi:hypothetical protein